MADPVEKLSTLIDPARISTDREHLDELSWDALSVGRIHPLKQPQFAAPICAARPISTDEVRRIVLFANAEKIPIVTFGGGSGLMGGALSIRPSIVLDIRGMNRIVETNTEARSARVQPGIVLEELDKQLNKAGFILGHDPWTLPVATVGGAISTNSVGYRAGAYGSMGEQVLGLEAVLPNSEILRTRAISKASAGINLNSLFIGGEGCFGIITEATIRIFPEPEARAIHAIHFDSFESGYKAIQKVFQLRLRPAVLDFGDGADEHESGAVLYLGFEGAQEVVEAEEKLALSVCGGAGGTNLPVEQAEDFWRNRHAIARHFMQNRRQRRERGRHGVYRDWIHVALPASNVLLFRQAALRIIQSHGVRLQESGLWIQPELFSMRLGVEDGDRANAQLALAQAVEDLLRLVQKMGGSMEYTHGVGIKLAPLMTGEHGYGIEVMRQFKKILDPNGIMNPGKMDL